MERNEATLRMARFVGTRHCRTGLCRLFALVFLKGNKFNWHSDEMISACPGSRES